MSTELKPRQDFLDTALACGATLTGKPDGSEAISVVFTIDAWRKFDSAIQQAAESEPVAWQYQPDDGLKFPGFTQYEAVAVSRGKPGTVLPLYTRPAPGVPEFTRIAKRKLDELQEQGFAITGYAIQRGLVRGFIDGGGFVGWWQGETDLGVPEGCILVKFDDMVRLASLIGPAPFEQNGKTYTFNVPNPDENLRLISATVRAMLAASRVQKGGA